MEKPSLARKATQKKSGAAAPLKRMNARGGGGRSQGPIDYSKIDYGKINYKKINIVDKFECFDEMLAMEFVVKFFTKDK